jgi:selenocysteine lyase/cysteine desulfurase
MDDTNREYSRREFLKLSGKTAAGAGIAAIMASSLSGCSSSNAAALTTDEQFWLAVRQNDFTLRSNYVYANNSTLGATLNSVQAKMAQVARIFGEGCYLDRWVDEIIRTLSPMLGSFAQLVNAHTDSASPGRYCATVSSVTEGMSLVANGLTFAPDDVIVTTDHEHPGGLYMWKLQAERYGARVIQVQLFAPGDTEATWSANLIERFRQVCSGSDKIKVISFPAITSSTGHILPMREICALARSIGSISVVDAAQAFTVIPLDVKALDCDVLVANGHKYLCGPIGSGFMTFHPRLLGTVSSFWGTIVDDNYFHPENSARNFPHRKGGVQAFTNILPLSDAIAQITKLGMTTIHKRLLTIGQIIRADLASYPDRFELITPIDASLGCVMTSLRVKGISSEEVYQLLRDRYAIHVKHSAEGFTTQYAGAINGAVRLSPHYYITEEEISRILTALHEIAGV